MQIIMCMNLTNETPRINFYVKSARDNLYIVDNQSEINGNILHQLTYMHKLSVIT